MAVDPLQDLNTYYGTAFKSKEALLTGMDSINQQILNLLGIIPSEIPFEPTYGSSLQSYLFEPVDPTTAFNIKILIFRAIERWLPFIAMIPSESSVLADNKQEGYIVTISYAIKGTDQTGSVRAQLAA